MTEPLYPVTIIRTRYGGVYEGGDWAAFNCDEWDVPGDATAGDPECEAFWREPKAVRVGVGGTPDQALAALLRAVGDGAPLVSGEKGARDLVARSVTGVMHACPAPTSPGKAAEEARIIESAANVARAQVEGIAAFARALRAGAVDRMNEGT